VKKEKQPTWAHPSTNTVIPNYVELGDVILFRCSAVHVFFLRCSAPLLTCCLTAAVLFSSYPYSSEVILLLLCCIQGPMHGPCTHTGIGYRPGHKMIDVAIIDGHIYQSSVPGQLSIRGAMCVVQSPHPSHPSLPNTPKKKKHTHPAPQSTSVSPVLEADLADPKVPGA